MNMDEKLVLFTMLIVYNGYGFTEEMQTMWTNWPYSDSSSREQYFELGQGEKLAMKFHHPEYSVETWRSNCFIIPEDNKYLALRPQLLLNREFQCVEQYEHCLYTDFRGQCDFLNYTICDITGLCDVNILNQSNVVNRFNNFAFSEEKILYHQIFIYSTYGSSPIYLEADVILQAERNIKIRISCQNIWWTQQIPAYPTNLSFVPESNDQTTSQTSRTSMPTLSTLPEIYSDAITEEVHTTTSAVHIQSDDGEMTTSALPEIISPVKDDAFEMNSRGKNGAIVIYAVVGIILSVAVVTLVVTLMILAVLLRKRTKLYQPNMQSI